jgi:hypothetical protein
MGTSRRRIAILAVAATIAAGTFVAGPRTGAHAAGECETAKQTGKRVPITDMRAVNYGADIFYRGPDDPPGGGNTLTGEAPQIAHDLAEITSANANAVRIFIRPYDFTSSSTDVLASPDGDKLAFLDDFISIACNAGLFTYITLFDQSQPFSNVSESETWADGILTKHAGDLRIIGIDLINEINADGSAALTWAAALIPHIQATANGIPVTASDSDDPSFITTLGNALGAAQPDFYDLHYYGSQDCNLPPSNYQAAYPSTVPTESQMQASLKCAQDNANAFGNRHLVIGETGYGTCAPTEKTCGPCDPNGTACGPCGTTGSSCPPCATSDPTCIATRAATTALGGSGVAGEENQVTWYETVWQAAQALGLPAPAPWEFEDFVPGPNACANLSAIDWSQQPQWLGLYRCDHTAKPALAVVQWYFTKFQSSTLP